MDVHCSIELSVNNKLLNTQKTGSWNKHLANHSIPFLIPFITSELKLYSLALIKKMFWTVGIVCVGFGSYQPMLKKCSLENYCISTRRYVFTLSFVNTIKTTFIQK